MVIITYEELPILQKFSKSELRALKNLILVSVEHRRNDIGNESLFSSLEKIENSLLETENFELDLDQAVYTVTQIGAINNMKKKELDVKAVQATFQSMNKRLEKTLRNILSNKNSLFFRGEEIDYKQVVFSKAQLNALATCINNLFGTLLDEFIEENKKSGWILEKLLKTPQLFLEDEKEEVESPDLLKFDINMRFNNQLQNSVVKKRIITKRVESYNYNSELDTLREEGEMKHQAIIDEGEYEHYLNESEKNRYEDHYGDNDSGWIYDDEE